ncbi:hypothetical protein [Paenibacillus zanthoxyli]|nr:hypothetical protein [Paenibacillus zanthoxyli]
MACVSNINNFVNGSINYNETSYGIIPLAKWVSYQIGEKAVA